ncbi:MAG: hypothetical protein ABIJ14_01115 [Nanoarchaeota archaeon]
MKVDISKLEDINPTRGGGRKSSFVLTKSGYPRWNEPYMEEHKEFASANSVNLKGAKNGNKLTIAINLLKDKTGKFVVNSHKDKNGKIKSKSFSLRSVFKQLGLSYKDFGQEKRIVIKPEIQDFEGKRYFVFELDIE